MSYLNPLLSYGYEKLAAASVAAGVCGYIVPDLPLDESESLRAALDRHGIALVQMVTPVTPAARLARLCAASQGFVYAVTMTGTTGKNVANPSDVLELSGARAGRGQRAGVRGIRYPHPRAGRGAARCRRWRHRRIGAGRGARARRVAAGVVGIAPSPSAVTERPSAAAATPRLALILALLATLGSYTIDAFFPSMRAMAAEFGISYWQVQQTLTVYLVPYACMSLVHGSLSDAVGRRRVVLVGLVLYALASMGCALAPGFGALLFFRALQGMVGGVGMIIGRAVVRDCFSGAAGAARHECHHHHVQPRPGAGPGDRRLDPRVARLARGVWQHGAVCTGARVDGVSASCPRPWAWRIARRSSSARWQAICTAWRAIRSFCC